MRPKHTLAAVTSPQRPRPVLLHLENNVNNPSVYFRPTGHCWSAVSRSSLPSWIIILIICQFSRSWHNQLWQRHTRELVQWLMLGEWSGCCGFQSPVPVPILATMTSSVLVRLFAAMTSSIGPVGNALRVIRFVVVCKVQCWSRFWQRWLKRIGPVACSDVCYSDVQYWSWYL